MKVEVPNTLKGVSLEKFQRLSEIENPTDNDKLNILLGLDRDLVRRLKAKSVAELSVHLNSLLAREYKLIRTFELGGKTWGFIPSLDDASYGEIDDIQDFIKEVSTAHKAMGVLYRPVTSKRKGKYLIEDYVPGKYDEQMKGAPLDVYFSAYVFFYHLMSDLLSCIPRYLEKELLKQMPSEPVLQENGVDILGCVRSLTEMSLILKEHPGLTFISPIQN